MNSVFESGTGGCGCCFPTSCGSGCSGLCGVFRTLFVLYSNDLSSEPLLWTS